MGIAHLLAWHQLATSIVVFPDIDQGGIPEHRRTNSAVVSKLFKMSCQLELMYSIQVVTG